MADFRIADQTINVLQKSLDLRAQKQQVIAANIANAETPGYAARKISFEDNLQQAIERPAAARPGPTDPRHFPLGAGGVDSVRARIDRVEQQSPLGDGNSVSLDEEMLDMAENQLLFEASSQMLKKKFSMLKYVAGGGR